MEEIAGVSVPGQYRLDAREDTRGRNSDNAKIRASLGWTPATRVNDGLERTYREIYDQVTIGQLDRAV